VIRLAGWLSGGRINQKGYCEPYPSALNEWRDLRAKYPADFTVSPQQAIAWHQKETEECEAAEDWRAALFHLGRGLALKPGRPDLYHRRGQAWAELGQWAKASADLAKAIQLKVEGTKVWYQHALLLLHAGDIKGYRQVCARLLKRYGQEKDPDTANQVAWTCVLAPDAVADYARVLPWVHNAVVGNPKRTEILGTLGAVLYRAKRYEEAIQRLNESIEKCDKVGEPQEWLFLAMAHHHLKKTNESRKWLDKAVLGIEKAEREKSLSWDERLEVQVLRREAEELLKKPGLKPEK
jgi:tetratricopeptide (TPR) repeat protein